LYLKNENPNQAAFAEALSSKVRGRLSLILPQKNGGPIKTLSSVLYKAYFPFKQVSTSYLLNASDSVVIKLSVAPGLSAVSLPSVRAYYERDH
jgi:hypothetical protein